MYSCCGSNAPIVYKLKIGDKITGLLELEQAFMDVRDLNLLDNEVAQKLLEIVGYKNYIPECAESEYRKALLAEYKKYIAKSK
ncbi:MAG: hypothetical protein XD78_1170 [Desulfotomaculum sp. 46_296]|nr:MAG: hypothetical protein XD78_1170 [Desulfotomaculum sp. 46_296]HAU32400.1 hypothetical protein [Desulfotomaculum sp.]